MQAIEVAQVLISRWSVDEIVRPWELSSRDRGKERWEELTSYVGSARVELLTVCHYASPSETLSLCVSSLLTRSRGGCVSQGAAHLTLTKPPA